MQDEVNQEDSEQNEVDGIKKGTQVGAWPGCRCGVRSARILTDFILAQI